jgi:hypothetical protein
MKSAALEELNRCFFIHLGLALDIHPLALQVWFAALRFALPPPVFSFVLIQHSRWLHFAVKFYQIVC